MSTLAPPKGVRLSAHGLGKSFGERTAVRCVDLALVAGRTHVLLGPNGAGKSTIIGMLSGLITPDSGGVERRDGATKALGLAPQGLAFYPDLTGRENLALFGRLHGLRGPALAHAVADALDLVGLGDRGGDLAGSYSGGMQRRLTLAMAVVHGPDVLLLDEPTAGVDPQSKALLFDRLSDLRRSGVATLITTHDLDDAEAIADDITIIDHGGVVAAGDIAALRAGSSLQDVVVLRATGLSAETVTAIAESAHATVRVEGDIALFAVDDGARALASIVGAAAAAGGSVIEVETRRSGLAELFLELTGRDLRDGS